MRVLFQSTVFILYILRPLQRILRSTTEEQMGPTVTFSRRVTAVQNSRAISELPEYWLKNRQSPGGRLRWQTSAPTRRGALPFVIMYWPQAPHRIPLQLPPPFGVNVASLRKAPEQNTPKCRLAYVKDGPQGCVSRWCAGWGEISQSDKSEGWGRGQRWRALSKGALAFVR